MKKEKLKMDNNKMYGCRKTYTRIHGINEKSTSYEMERAFLCSKYSSLVVRLKYIIIYISIIIFYIFKNKNIKKYSIFHQNSKEKIRSFLFIITSMPGTFV